MKEKDHIENYFKKYLEHYEESPDENFWVEISPAIEVPKQKNSNKAIWILLLLLSLLLTRFLLRSITWDRELELEKEQSSVSIVADHLFVDTIINREDQVAVSQKEAKPIHKENKKINQSEIKELHTKEKSDLTSQKQLVESLTGISPEDEITLNSSEGNEEIPSIEQQLLELLPSKVATLNYVAPELPMLSRSLRVQPYVSLHSYQLQGVNYEGIRKMGGTTTDRILTRPINTILNLGIDAGVVLNEQFYIQIGFNRNYSEFTYTGIVNRTLEEQEIAILFDGVPINFDFTMDAYFDEIDGTLKLTPKTTEIEAGNKSFSIEARLKVQTTRWILATAYKLDVNDVIRLTPKIGVSKVSTKYQQYEHLSGEEKLLDSNGEIIENQLNVEANQTSMNEEVQLENIEGVFGFQLEIPLDKSRKWSLVPAGELWFDWTPGLERPNLTLKRSTLTLGAGVRYTIK